MSVTAATARLGPKSEFIMCLGLPGSGKSTWAKRLVEEDNRYVRINRDDLRLMLHGDAEWSPKREKVTVVARNALIHAVLASGRSVVCDDTNLAPSVQEELQRLAKQWNAEFKIQDFTDVPYRECIRRDLKRAHSVGKDVILRMYDDYLRPPLLVQDETLPHCILVDMDGTLARLGNHRGPYDDHRCDEDEPFEYVVNLIQGFLESRPNVNLIIVSGRNEDRARIPTETWLERHGFKPQAVLLRSGDDNRPDTVVKRELYEEFIKDKFYVEFVVEDRQVVVDLWRRDLGLPCAQVDYGNM